MNLPEPVLCFFCEKKLIPFGNERPGKEFFKEWNDKYGSTDKEFTRIGKRSICQNCTSDMQQICKEGQTK
jgi:hypothetical protein